MCGRRRRDTRRCRSRNGRGRCLGAALRGSGGSRGGRGGARRRSLAGARWRRSGGRGRCWRCARGWKRRREELVALVSADMGKTLADADGEVGRGIESVESAAAVPHLLKGETLEGVAAGVDVEMVRQPVGVVAAITPFNFPAMIPLWFLPYAIACGNSFILKPSEQDPRPAALIMEVVDAVEEIPRGRGQPGPRRPRGGDRDPRATRRSTRSPSSAGPRRPASSPKARCARASACRRSAAPRTPWSSCPTPISSRRCRRSWAPPSAPPGSAAWPDRSACSSATRRGGPRCARRWSRRPPGSRSGPGSDPETDVCPMVSAAARDKVAAAIERPPATAPRSCWTAAATRARPGLFSGPTIAAVADPESELARDELFGPLLTWSRWTTSTRRSSSSTARATATPARSSPARARRPASTATRPRRDARRQRRRPRSGRLVPVRGWKDSIDGDLHANGDRRGRLLHAEEGRY